MKRRLPISMRNVAKVIRAVQKDVSGSFLLVMVGEKDVGKRALSSLITFESGDCTDRIKVFDVMGVIDPEQFSVMKNADLVVPVVDGSKELPGWLKPLTKDLKKFEVPLLTVLNKADIAKEGYEGLESKAISDLEIGKKDAVAISLLKGERIKESLFPAIAAKAKEFRLALGGCFPVFRDLIADEIIAATSRQNGIVGFLVFLPGADFPVLTLNQMRMVLSLAALYGEKLNLQRAVEIVVMFGGGLTFRAMARELLDLLPGVGWLVKGAVAYSGTVAIGKGAQKYFDSGTRVTPGTVVSIAKGLVDLGFGSKMARTDSSQG